MRTNSRVIGYIKNHTWEIFCKAIEIILIVVFIRILFSGIVNVGSWDGNTYVETKITWNNLLISIRIIVDNLKAVL